MKAKSTRSSGLELLRIIAMLMVFGHHFILYNGVSIWGMPFSVTRLFCAVGLYDMGKVGVLVFFTITAWFLSGSEGGYVKDFGACGLWNANCSSIVSPSI